MDSMIPLGQKNTLVEYMILFDANNRPPMLDKDLYDSWKSRMELYMQNREHGRMILESVENGLLIWPTIKENEVTRTKKYAELSVAEKIRVDCDMKATNIILQGLPVDIYSLERECKLYDDMNIKDESLHKYYLRFTQMINDMNIYNKKMEQFQDLHTTNFDQLHAYLEQHELHANEFRLLRERNQDPLAFYGSIHPNQHYSSTYPSQLQFNLSSVQPSYPYQSQISTQPMTESPLVDSSFVVPVFSPGDDPIACLNKAMAFLMAVASSRGDKVKVILVLVIVTPPKSGRIGMPKRTRNVAWYKKKAMLVEAKEAGQILDEEQLVFLADLGVLDGQVVPQSETNLNDMENQSVLAMQDFEQSPVIDFTDNERHKRYKERIKNFERLNIDLSSRENMIDSQMDDMIREKLALKEQVDSLEQNLSKQIKEKECLLQTFTVFKNDSKEKENKYMKLNWFREEDKGS
ncbi:hypothetical protein Tco_0991847 [Tanacetum coccineum]|uniref:Integrase, catalytic region, zinc finger, CCHC-type, peptidase aspartic, catalytic n=1 Tax=Tanacetum coccineum TaxID=301880 RepID=A0ABQ5F159_9ASTR